MTDHLTIEERAAKCAKEIVKCDGSGDCFHPGCCKSRFEKVSGDIARHIRAAVEQERKKIADYLRKEFDNQREPNDLWRYVIADLIEKGTYGD